LKLCVLTPHSMHLAALTQPWEYSLDGNDVCTAMQLADDLGFAKVVMGEHFVIPTNHLSLSGDHYFHTAVALGVIGGCTKNIRMTPAISILPLQHPIVQAKAWATLDWMTCGRAEVMFGVGWLKEEFEFLNVPFHERGKMADEYAAAMIALWHNDCATFEGKYVSFRDACLAPKPVQKPHLPMWFGGDAEAMQKRVAKFGDGWQPQTLHPERFPERIDFIKSQPEYDGRPIGISFALDQLKVGKEHEVLSDPLTAGSRDAQEVIDQIGWLASRGVTETSVPIPRLQDFQEYLDYLGWIGAEIIPAVRDI